MLWLDDDGWCIYKLCNIDYVMYALCVNRRVMCVVCGVVVMCCAYVTVCVSCVVCVSLHVFATCGLHYVYGPPYDIYVMCIIIV